METARLSYTSAADYMSMTIGDFSEFRKALYNVLEREIEAKKEARNG